MVHNFSKVESRRGFWSKIDMKTRLSVDRWIRNHHHVVHSPIARDTLLVLDFQSNKIVRKNKLLLQCPVRELHSDLYSPIIGLGNTVRDKKGKHLISDTMFRTLLPQELLQWRTDTSSNVVVPNARVLNTCSQRWINLGSRICDNWKTNFNTCQFPPVTKNMLEQSLRPIILYMWGWIPSL